MQIHQQCDPHLHICNMKVKLEIPAKQAMAPSRSLPRSASEIADPPSPFSSNPAHIPASMPTTPATASSLSSCPSFGRTGTDTPPITPKQGKPKPTPAAAAAAYYASLWSPRRLMQRAARAFRTSRSRGRGRAPAKDGPEERALIVVTTTSKQVCDAAAAAAVAVAVAVAPAGAEVAGGKDAHDGAGLDEQQPQDHHHEDHQDPEAVPEKIIHVANHHAPARVVAEDDDGCGKTTTPPAEEKEKEKETNANAAGAAMEEEAAESPKKGAAPEPEPEPMAASAAAEELADKFVAVVKEAIKNKKHEAEQEQQGGEKKEAMRRFQGSRVKTAMEARAESEHPRRREVARSNDVIEEARTKFLEKRQCSRVRALVGAFETVMDTAKDAGTPQHRPRKSV